LYRYTTGEGADEAVGLCTVNSVDP
jgi:hypothetical protein